MKLSPAQIEALLDASAGCLYRQRENGTYVRRPTVDGLINRGLLKPGFPNEITDLGREELGKANPDYDFTEVEAEGDNTVKAGEIASGETIINAAHGTDLLVSRRGNRVRVIVDRTEPVEITRTPGSDFVFLPGWLCSVEESRPYLENMR